ncbi:MAG: NHLP bacteriocin export ABC transporter permease/ATPase subunit [Eubacteriales bacterium]|nr:NHLP bacteriocin export ABC transporter permease/ATPase subunit [Eubacteriales bacterium]
MGWFDEQIRARKKNDDDAFAEAFANMASAITGKKGAALNSDRAATKSAIDEILKYYHVKSREIPESITDRNEQLEYLMRPYGIMRRTVKLEGTWYRDAVGAMLGVLRESGKVVALLPAGLSGYSYYDYETGKRRRINRRRALLFEEEAVAFYKPFPLKKMSLSSLAKYIVQSLSASDLVLIALATLALSLVGMIAPALNKLLFGRVLESQSVRLLAGIAVFSVCVSVSTLLINAVKNMITARIETKLNIWVEAATMMRVMSLPADFFKTYSAGELSSRTSQVGALCRMLVSTVLSAGLTSVFSLIYISQIFAYAPTLVVPALIIILVTVVFSVVSSLVQMKLSTQQMELSGKESGMIYSLITGIQKIRLAGAEKRAFARWGNLYARSASLEYGPPLFIELNSVISLAISLTGTLVMYSLSVKSGISVADYYAFDTAYGMVSGAFMSLAGIALTAAQIKPVLTMVKPFFDAVPEVSDGKQVLTRLSGGIELNNVSFGYSDSMPPVIDNLSLKIRPGQYVAIVGKTGCGKSTLMRLLLGFEHPKKGAIYYDGRDLEKIELRSLRRRIGVVMQNGKLFQGDIYSNIVISAPWLSRQDAWDAAELAGIADDIRSMPMGMDTMISEGAGGISGGQRQRLMIARAIAPKPKILMFDEATSALDNLTQKKISQSLDSLKCTRIVIAHRLSTIRQCDRIIVLDQGKIIEDGRYQELIEKNGFFAELVARQRLDSVPETEHP